MFNKIKNKLKYKLMNWLEIEKLQENYKEYIRRNDRNISKLNDNININWKATEHSYNELYKRVTNTYNEQEKQINALNRTLQSVVSLGADITRVPYDRNKSWAVVCIEGKYNVVKFIDLHGQDYRHILEYLKQFECSRRVIDAPYREMFEKGFTLFNDK